MPDVAEYVALAQAACEAQGATFYIGVRPLEKGWFAHCDGVEYDGDGPDMAVRSVVQELQRRARAVSHKLEDENRLAERRRAGLDVLDASLPEQEAAALNDGRETP